MLSCFAIIALLIMLYLSCFPGCAIGKYVVLSLPITELNRKGVPLVWGSAFVVYPTTF